MRVRILLPSDLPVLKAIFDRSGFKYDWPDLNSRNFVVKQALVDDSNRPVMAAVAHKTVEAYLLADSEWNTPRWRLEGLKLLHESMRRSLFGLGYEDVHAWLPPQVSGSFGKRLEMLGWVAPKWKDYVLQLETA